jgi:methylmalonyl-CoA mutase
VDPWAGSYMMERLTADLIERAREVMAEVEREGGMAKAIEKGMPKRRIEEAAARRQSRIDSGEEVIVGVNKYVVQKPEDNVELLDVDNQAVLVEQTERLRELRAERDPQKAAAALAALEAGARDNANLLALSIDAMRARCTVGEVSDALEKVFGRHQADASVVTGVYAPNTGGHEHKAVAEARAAVTAFATREGRRPRLLVLKLGQDGHDRGAKVVASAFADMGFDVDVGPLFQTPEEGARLAIDSDVHVVGVSSLAAGHKTLVPQLVQALKAQGAGDIVVIAGGVIPPGDHQFLKDNGVACVFGPGTPIPQAALAVLQAIPARS